MAYLFGLVAREVNVHSRKLSGAAILAACLPLRPPFLVPPSHLRAQRTNRSANRFSRARNRESLPHWRGRCSGTRWRGPRSFRRRTHCFARRVGLGKSTLLNILGGLDVPTAGTLTYRGWDLTAADEDELTRFRRDSVGFIFQFYNLIPSLTGRENVALITDIARDPMAPEEALALVDLSDRLDHFPSQMSGGQQQRVAIARAIAKRPKCFFATNPLARSM
jgi:hypothetical protein